MTKEQAIESLKVLKEVTGISSVTLENLDEALLEYDKIQTYEKWIEENYPDYDSSKFQCFTAVQKMYTVFPELIPRAGIHFSIFGITEHRWLETKYGKIIDPTINQFKIAGSYHIPENGEEFETSMKCMWCGNHVILNWDDKWHNPFFPMPRLHHCSDKCLKLLEAD